VGDLEHARRAVRGEAEDAQRGRRVVERVHLQRRDVASASPRH
jgi:hypothetical protein